MNKDKRSFSPAGLLDMPSRMLALIFSLILISMLFFGCATPEISEKGILNPDEEDNIGGTFLESGDIRTISTTMAAAILSTPEVGGHDGLVRIAIAPIRNSTRFIIDKEIFMKRLRIELNRVASDRVRFLSQNVGQTVRREILQERDEEMWDQSIAEAANYIVSSRPVTGAANPPTIAIIPIRNTNIAGMNADSLMSLIRSELVQQANGKVTLLARERNGKVIEEILDEKDLKHLGMVKTKRIKDLYGVDYFLGGEFIAKSLMAEEAVKSNETTIGVSSEDPRVMESRTQQKTINPNVTKYLNVMLIDAETGEVPVEKLLSIENKMKSGLGRTNYLLTGEMSALSKASDRGKRSDYIILSFQLVDPETNEVLWEDAYESKRKSSVGTIYR